jgi:hypothetical protein
VIDGGLILENQLFDLFFEGTHLFEVETYFALLFARPYEWAIECLGGKVGREEGDRVEAEGPCGIDGLT